MIQNLDKNWEDETGSRPTDYEIICHLLTMPDEEYDCYMEGKPYTAREELRDQVEKDEKAKEEKEKIKNKK